MHNEEPQQTNKKRYAWIIVTIIIAIAVLIGAFLLGRFVRSGNDEAIANAQHKPEITAQVEEREFPAEPIEIKGSVQLGSTFPVTVAAGEGGQAIVTATPRSPGETISSGQLLAQVSGRPVIALDLPFDMYRDIKTGDTGADVRELQRALVRLGLYRGVVDGEYGPLTANAMKELYKRVGAVLPEPPKEPEAQPAAVQSQAQEPQSNPADQGATSTPPNPPAPSATQAPKKLNLPTIKANEIFSLTQGSATIIEIAPLNTKISAETPLAKLRSGKAIAVARVGVGDKNLFSVGANVELSAVGSTEKQQATVNAISEFKDADVNNPAAQLPGHDVSVDLPGEGYTDGQEIILSIANTERQAVSGLTVPLSALREDTGTTYVLKKDPAIKPEGTAKIEVSVGRTFDGFALITSDNIQAGDTVVIGQ
ncbi:peptidoglycan-binding protein [Arcanobacterium phocisimile]|uniref:Peptidoglycan-binding protein n=1 Tax=Arcanobacterium phocisimile TaxID=1302235 RepID=A0ABX7IJL6_9ACTO|nr:peptidoglycan-binding protein [Arcanobacterium phocisimile]QRV02724.1 peptidoglycan-binding protein [Arcanobacterium phocisimile]